MGGIKDSFISIRNYVNRMTMPDLTFVVFDSSSFQLTFVCR